MSHQTNRYLVGVHVVAMLGCQRPPHGQVDHVAHDGERESCADHVLPLVHQGQGRCWEPARKAEARSSCDTGVWVLVKWARSWCVQE